MANNEINIKITAMDRASKSLNNLSSKIKTFGEKNEQTFRSMRNVGAIAFGTLATTVGVATKAFMDQEKAEKRLEQIATQVTGATKEQIQGFKDLASATQKVGVVGDEVIIAGQSQISSFTKNAEVVRELTDDLADLAVATYGTNVSQEQSIQTANLLGKALQGQLGALTRTGILVSDEYAKAFEAANTEHERAIVLSKIVQDNYGGVNKAMRETAEGGLQALKNSFGDMMELLGQSFVPILNTVVAKLQPLVEKLSERVQNNPELTKNIILVTGAVAGLATVIGTVGLMLGPLAAVIGGLTAPILLVSAVVAGLAVARATNFGGIRDTVSELWDFLKESFGDIAETLIGTRTELCQVFTGSTNDATGEVQENFASLGDVLDAVFGAIVDVIAASIEIMTINIKMLVQVFSNLILFVKNVFTGNRKGAWDNVRNIFASIREALGGIIEAAIPGITGSVGRLGQGIKSIFTTIFDTIKDVATSAVNRVIDKINSVIDSINSVGGAVGIQIGKLQRLQSEIRTTASMQGGLIQNQGSRASGISSYLGTRAIGGPVTAGVPYLVGEYGPEIFVPPTNGKVENKGGGSNNITINVTGNQIKDENTIDMLVSEIERRIRRATGNITLYGM